jgi:hypothetical protein
MTLVRNAQFEAAHSDHNQVCEEMPDHHYRTEIPNIVFEMGLSPETFCLYVHLKRIAGDGGHCFKSIPNLAKDCGMGETKLRSSLKELETLNVLIGDERRGETKFNTEIRLIKLTPRKKPDGSADTNLITITPIWRLNGDVMRHRSQKKLGGSPHEGGVVRETSQGGSPHEGKEELSKKNPSKKQQQTTPVSAVAVSLSLEKIDIPHDEKIWISKNYTEETIRNAVEFSTHPLTTINTSLLQTIKWACKKNPQIPVDEAAESLKRKDEEREYFLENQQYAERLAKEYYLKTKDPYGVRLTFDNVELDLRGNGHSVKIYFGDKQFKQLIEHELRKGK